MSRTRSKISEKVVLVIFFSFILGCTTNYEGNLAKYPQIGEINLTFPSSLKPLNIQNGSISAFLTTESPKILLVLRGGCESCQIELNKWHSLIEDQEHLQKVPILAIIIESLNSSLESEILEQKKFPFPIYHDQSEDFIKSNDLQVLIDQRGAVLNEDNRVIFLGSPFIYPEFENTFFRALNN